MDKNFNVYQTEKEFFDAVDIVCMNCGEGSDITCVNCPVRHTVDNLVNSNSDIKNN